MNRAAHERFWPRGLPRRLRFPRSSPWYRLEVAATRQCGKPAIVFHDTVITYAQLRERVDRLAAFLQQRCGGADRRPGGIARIIRTPAQSGGADDARSRNGATPERARTGPSGDGKRPRGWPRGCEHGTSGGIQ